jgi:hypothetical protein
LDPFQANILHIDFLLLAYSGTSVPLLPESLLALALSLHTLSPLRALGLVDARVPNVHLVQANALHIDLIVRTN